MNTASPAFGSEDAARFLVSFFRVKLSCVCKIGGQLTQSVRRHSAQQGKIKNNSVRLKGIVNE